MKKLKYFADTIRRILGYFIAVALTVVFALYLSGRTGWFLFAVMVLLPVVSVVCTLITKKYINISAEISETELYKGSDVLLRITIENRSFLPTPPVILKHWSSDGLVCGENVHEFAANVLPRSVKVFETEYKAVLWCYAKVGLENACVTDYTGMLRFILPQFDNSDCAFDVRIIPDIKNISSNQDILKAADEAASRNDDSEDTADTRAVGFTGVPGYEHREYEPGDPLKRVNWKLSGKRGTLMVRLDDSVLSKKHSVIMDGVNASGSAKSGELCGETMLGILSVIIRSGFESKVWYNSGGVWCDADITDEMSLENFRMSLAGYRFEESIPERVPFRQLSELPGGAGAVILFTPCLDEELSAQLAHSGVYTKSDISVTAAAASVSDKAHGGSGIWLISEDGSIETI